MMAVNVTGSPKTLVLSDELTIMVVSPVIKAGGGGP